MPEDLIPLFVAAGIAYEQVFGKRSTENLIPSVDELDLVALALSSHIPLYGKIAENTAQIPSADLRRGMFWGGATRFENLQGDTFVGLAVSRSALERTLSTISLDSL